MSWYTVPGVDQDTVLHTQIQIFRNIHNTPFPAHLDADAASEMINEIGGVLGGNGFHKVDFSEISHAGAYAYAEKQYISPTFVRQSTVHALYLNEPCNLSVALCDTHHICIRALMPGLSLKDTFNSAYKIEGLLDTHFDFAFDERLGYLTQQPTLNGSGMSLSVMVFLPALSLSDRIPSLTGRLHEAGCLLQPVEERDGQAAGFLYRIHVIAPPDGDEQAVCSFAEHVIRQIVTEERARRKAFSEEQACMLMDQALRAEGILKHAYLLPVREFVELSSYLRLGIALGWTRDIRIEALNTLLVEVMPATLTSAADRPPKNQTEQDKLRATVVRERLAAAG